MAQPCRSGAQGRAVRAADQHAPTTASPSRRWRSAAPMRRRSPPARAERPGRYWRGSIIPIRRSPTRSRCVNSTTAPPACRWSLPARSAPMASACPQANRRSRARSKASTSTPARRSSSISRRKRAPCSTRCWRRALPSSHRGDRHSHRPRSDRRRRASARTRRAPWSEEAPHFARRLAALARDGFRGKLAVADGRIIHNAGGSEAQELAFVLAVGARLSARARSRRRRARCRAAHDLLSPRGRCRPVSDHREIPRAAEIVGAGRRRPAGLRRRRLSSRPRPPGA